MLQWGICYSQTDWKRHAAAELASTLHQVDHAYCMDEASAPPPVVVVASAAAAAAPSIDGARVIPRRRMHATAAGRQAPARPVPLHASIQPTLAEAV
jgi:hypothetical protein